MHQEWRQPNTLMSHGWVPGAPLQSATFVPGLRLSYSPTQRTYTTVEYSEESMNSMKTLQSVVLCCGLMAAHAAFADTNSNAVKMANGLNAPKTYTGIHPPKGTKASGFAPTPGNRRHVYGAPIQSPIFKSSPVKKPNTPPMAKAPSSG
jgi:hypothetical protein